MKPTIGRIVHYTNLGDRDGKYPPEVQAAIITRAKEKDTPIGDNEPEEMHHVVALHIFYPTGQFDIQDVPFTKAKAGSEEARGKWSWPERS